MRDLFYKFMPWIFGFLLGWLLWSPPVWLRSLGPASYAVNLLLCGLLLLSVIAWLILANFPARLTMDPVAEDEVPAELRQVFPDEEPRVTMMPAAVATRREGMSPTSPSPTVRRE